MFCLPEWSERLVKWEETLHASSRILLIRKMAREKGVILACDITEGWEMYGERGNRSRGGTCRRGEGMAGGGGVLTK